MEGELADVKPSEAVSSALGAKAGDGLLLVSGASGFIGGHILAAARAAGRPVRAMFRRAEQASDSGSAAIADLGDPQALARACVEVRTVIHCAGYAHAMGTDDEVARRHRAINFEGSLALAQAAAAAGVQRFVFLSSVKARGEPGEACADEDWPGDPETPYGLAKWQAESALRRLSASTGMELVVLRPVMVYGRGGRGNLERMAAAVVRGWFPALPETGNRRSLIHVDDVVDAALLCARAPEAAGQCFNLSHSDAVSGAALLAALHQACGRPAPHGVLPAPAWRLFGRLGDALRAAGWQRCPINSEVVSRLLDSACYSPSRIATVLGWQARIDLAHGLREMLGGG